MTSPHPPAEVLTTNLRIRNMTDSPADAADMHTLRRRADVMRWTNTTPETSIAQTHAWVRDKLSKPAEIYNFVIELREPGAYLTWPPGDDFTMALPRRVVGIVGAVGRAEVGYMVHPAYKGRGIATEALEGFMPLYWAWRELQRGGHEQEVGEREDGQPGKILAKGDEVRQDESKEQGRGDCEEYDFVEADTDVENYASHRVLLKCGFVEWERVNDDFQSPMMGLRSTIKFRLPRPGTQLKSKAEYAKRKNEDVVANGIG